MKQIFMSMAEIETPTDLRDGEVVAAVRLALALIAVTSTSTSAASLSDRTRFVRYGRRAAGFA